MKHNERCAGAGAGSSAPTTGLHLLRPAPSPTRSLMRPLLLIAALGFALIACDDPCEKLHKKVCDDPTYLRTNKRHCELMNEQARREALPKDYCESIIKSIAKQ